MKLTIELEAAELSPEVLTTIQSLANAAPPRKRGPGRPRKSEPKAEPEPAPAPAPEPTVDDADMFGEEKTYTLDDVRAALRDFAAKNGREKAVELLKKHGADAPSKLKESQYAEVVEAIGA